jgi:hypothetical protein
VDNPWRQLPEQPPYVLPSDVGAVASFNRRVNDDHRLHTDKLPEPFLGDPAAPIVLLNLNPGFKESDHLFVADPCGRALQLGNLRHAPTAYPFYHLDPRIADFGGAKWWKPRLGALIRLVGAEIVANRILCVEFFPYSSRSYREMGRILDSQRYGFHLVERAIDRRALIVAMRSRKLWCAHVPRLATYERLHACSNWRQPYISPGNLPTVFPLIERILRE